MTEFRPVPLSSLLVGPTEVDWVMTPIIPPSSIGFVAGSGGIGKSWLVNDMAICFASGQPWLGRFAVKRCRVLVIDEENAELLLRVRFTKLLKAHELGRGTDIDFLVGTGFNVSPSVKIGMPEHVESMIKTIRDGKYGVVIIDSLVRIHHVDENSADRMAVVNENLRNIVRETGVAIVINHHFNKGGQEMRGSTDIYNSADWALKVFEEQKGVLRVEHDKSRWGRNIGKFMVNFDDYDLDGEPDNPFYIVCDDEVGEMEESKSSMMDVLKLLKTKPMTTVQLSSVMDLSDRHIRRLISRLQDDGRIVCDHDEDDHRRIVYSVVPDEYDTLRELGQSGKLQI